MDDISASAWLKVDSQCSLTLFTNKSAINLLQSICSLVRLSLKEPLWRKALSDAFQLQPCRIGLLEWLQNLEARISHTDPSIDNSPGFICIGPQDILIFYSSLVGVFDVDMCQAAVLMSCLKDSTRALNGFETPVIIES